MKLSPLTLWRRLRRLVLRGVCLILGHRSYMTGRQCPSLIEWKCCRCDELRVSLPCFLSITIPGDARTEKIFSHPANKQQNAASAASGKPH